MPKSRKNNKKTSLPRRIFRMFKVGLIFAILIGTFYLGYVSKGYNTPETRARTRENVKELVSKSFATTKQFVVNQMKREEPKKVSQK